MARTAIVFAAMVRATEYERFAAVGVERRYFRLCGRCAEPRRPEERGSREKPG